MTTPGETRSEKVDGIGAALARFAEASPPSTPPPTPSAPPRPLRDAALGLLTAAAVAVALDSEGLVGWAQRLEVSRGQAVLLAVLQPVHGALSEVGATRPRQALASMRDDLAARFGAAEDPLLAGGWVGAAERPVPGASRDAGLAEAAPVVVATVPRPARVAEPEDWREGVVLLGDSMIAGSLGATLKAAFERDGRWRVAQAYQLGTGLARPEVYDWMRVVPPLLERERPSFIIVSLGANDGTNLREGSEQLDFGHPRWRQVYEARVEALMRALVSGGAQVLWLGLPPMREPGLARRTAALNGIFASVAARVPGVAFLEFDMLVSPGRREYATFLRGPDGKLVRYRLDDGVHLAPAASRAIARWVLDWVHERQR